MVIIRNLLFRLDKLANPSELKLIRTALDLSQAEMGRLLGVNAQSAYQFWETNPDKPASRQALEKAKEVYLARTGLPWVSGPTLRDLVRKEPEVYQAGASEHIPGMGKLIGFPDLEAADRIRDATRAVMKALYAEGLKGVDPETENWLIDQYVDGLAAGRTQQLLDARLGLALQLLREHRQGKGAE